MRVKNDIAATLDEKDKVVLVMLDRSNAIDTINHDILMNRLQHSVGITDAALSWLHSYITERYQRIAVDSATSADCVMKCGVPQGSSTWTNSVLHIHETHRWHCCTAWPAIPLLY